MAPSAAGNWHRQYRRTRSYAPLAMGADRRWKLSGELGWIAERLAAVYDLTPAEVRSDLAARGVVVSYAGVQAYRRSAYGEAAGITLKKTIFTTEQDRPDVAMARQLRRAAQAGLDFTSLVFVDETSTNMAMTRTHG